MRTCSYTFDRPREPDPLADLLALPALLALRPGKMPGGCEGISEGILPSFGKALSALRNRRPGRARCPCFQDALAVLARCRMYARAAWLAAVATVPILGLPSRGRGRLWMRGRLCMTGAHGSCRPQIPELTATSHRYGSIGPMRCRATTNRVTFDVYRNVVSFVEGRWERKRTRFLRRLHLIALESVFSMKSQIVWMRPKTSVLRHKNLSTGTQQCTYLIWHTILSDQNTIVVIDRD